MEAQQKAQLESMVSSLIALASSINGEEYSKNDPDLREVVRDGLLKLVENSFIPDETSWQFVKDQYLYDVYLLKRQDEGTMTKTDETRKGLSVANFSDPVEYHRHQIRIANSRKNSDPGSGPGPEEVKTCTTCGETKPATKFSRKGGATCFSCKGKKYRGTLNEA